MFLDSAAVEPAGAASIAPPLMLTLLLPTLSASKVSRPPKNGFLLVAGLFLLFAVARPFDASAVLIATGDGTGNTTAPAADPGFANVGTIGSNSGVYVRNGWVLTANHVGANPIVLQGIPFDPIPGSRVRFQNPDLTFADLIVYKLQSKPALPDLQLTDSAPSSNTLVLFIGNGRDRAATTSFDGNDGWFWGSSRTLRWGTNRIALEDAFVNDTQSFVIQFNDITGSPPDQHEADLVNGDSGGGTFTGSGASAELIGIIFARQNLEGQPPNTSIFGNFGIIVDLFAYRNDILALIDQPDCDNGLDDDGDGLIDFPNDPGCSDAFDSDERGANIECDNGLDDDGDGDVDFPDDSGCENAMDDSEFVIPIPTGLLGAGLFTLFALGLLARKSISVPEAADER
jgi:hypothetical protein